MKQDKESASEVSTPSIDLSANNNETNTSDYDELDSWSVIFSTDDTNSDSETRSNLSYGGIDLVSEDTNSRPSSSGSAKYRNRTANTSSPATTPSGTSGDENDGTSVSISTLKSSSTPTSCENSFTFPSLKIQNNKEHSNSFVIASNSNSSIATISNKPKSSSFVQRLNYFESLKNEDRERENSKSKKTFKNTKLFNDSKEFFESSKDYVNSINNKYNLTIKHYILIAISLLVLSITTFIYNSYPIIEEVPVVEPVSYHSNIINSFDTLIYPKKSEPIKVKKCYLKYICYEKVTIASQKNSFWESIATQVKLPMNHISAQYLILKDHLSDFSQNSVARWSRISDDSIIATQAIFNDLEEHIAVLNGHISRFSVSSINQWKHFTESFNNFSTSLTNQINRYAYTCTSQSKEFFQLLEKNGYIYKEQLKYSIQRSKNFLPSSDLTICTTVVKSVQNKLQELHVHFDSFKSFAKNATAQASKNTILGTQFLQSGKFWQSVKPSYKSPISALKESDSNVSRVVKDAALFTHSVFQKVKKTVLK